MAHPERSVPAVEDIEDSSHKPLRWICDRARPRPFSVDSENILCENRIDAGHFCQELDGVAVKRSQIPGSYDVFEML